MLSIFKKKKDNLLVFVVEDNDMYKHQLTFFLEKQFGDKLKIRTFKVSEIAVLELDKKPDVIIMDYFLNSKYEDAADGYSTLIDIHDKYPSIKLILHTAQLDVDFAAEVAKTGIAEYISKNKDSMERIADVINSVFES